MFSLPDAIKLAVEKHAGQYDKSGMPYILHPLHVMNELLKKHYGMEYLQAGVLHDAVEDTDLTIEELRKLGVSDDVVSAIEALTHLDNVPYEDYIEIVAKNRIARVVKIEDLRHNMDVTRRVTPVWNDERINGYTRRLVKYIKAYDRLVGGQLNV